MPLHNVTADLLHRVPGIFPGMFWPILHRITHLTMPYRYEGG